MTAGRPNRKINLVLWYAIHQKFGTLSACSTWIKMCLGDENPKKDSVSDWVGCRIMPRSQIMDLLADKLGIPVELLFDEKLYIKEKK